MLSYQVFDERATYFRPSRHDATWHLHLAMSVDESLLAERLEKRTDMLVYLTRYGRIEYEAAANMDMVEAGEHMDAIGRWMKHEAPEETVGSM